MEYAPATRNVVGASPQCHTRAWQAMRLPYNAAATRANMTSNSAPPTMCDARA